MWKMCDTETVLVESLDERFLITLFLVLLERRTCCFPREVCEISMETLCIISYPRALE